MFVWEERYVANVQLIGQYGSNDLVAWEKYSVPTYDGSDSMEGTICLHRRVTTFSSYNGSDSLGETICFHRKINLTVRYN